MYIYIYMCVFLVVMKDREQEIEGTNDIKGI